MTTSTLHHPAANPSRARLGLLAAALAVAAAVPAAIVLADDDEAVPRSLTPAPAEDSGGVVGSADALERRLTPTTSPVTGSADALERRADG